MKTDIDQTALAVFLFFFALVTIMGFIAARWRRPQTLAHLDEWGLGGRQFGPGIGVCSRSLHVSTHADRYFRQPQRGNTIRKNAILLPAYTLMLGLLALLGYMGHAAHLNLAS